MALTNRETLPEITRKTLLYKSGVEYAGYALNHAEGCAHGCNFPCYAMMMKKRCGRVKDYDDWLKPRIVANALDLLEKEIPKLKHKIGYVTMCFATDPFMYRVPQIAELSLKIIERLNRAQIKVVSITKGLYPDDLTDKDTYGVDNEYGVTIVSLSEEFHEKYEPYAAPVKERIAALKKLHDSGLKTWVSMEPYPTPNIIKQDLGDILEAVSFVDKIIFGKWNYSRLISSYKGRNEFYDEAAREVLDFCRARGIDVYMKEGTISGSSSGKMPEETGAEINKHIFYDNKQQELFS
jgi:DNA repair photolyase